MNKARLTVALAVLALLALAPGIAAAVPAAPFETNDECLGCHDLAEGAGALTRVDFEVPGYPGPDVAWDRTGPTVDQGKCGNCHWVTSHFFHDTATDNCSCHSFGAGTVTDYFRTLVNVPGVGNFTSANSPSRSASYIHDVHVSGSWPKNVDYKSNLGLPKCASCHASAACDACHAEPVSHGDHGTWDGAIAGAEYVSTTGASAAQANVNTSSLKTSACADSRCHSRDAAVTTEVNTDYAATTFTYSGRYAGTILYPPAYTNVGGTATLNLTLAEDGFLRLYGTNDPYGAIVRIVLDGQAEVLVDTYAPLVVGRAQWFEANLAAGTHVVTIQNTGLRNPLAVTGTAKPALARISTYSPNPVSFVPTCQSCHTDTTLDPVDRTQTHGYETIDHEGDVGTDVGDGGKTCESCHAMDVLTEHERPSSASAGGVCVTCHPTPRDSFAAWDQSCQQGACHAEGSPQDPHSQMAADHTPPAAGEACAGCHPGDLGAVHADAASSDDSSVTSCNVCHSQALYPTTNDCTVCHFTFDEHYDPVQHLSTNELAGCTGSTCHGTRDLMGAHQEKNPEFDCLGCHASTRPEVVVAIDSGLTDCADCHDVDTGHYDVHSVEPPLLNSDGTSNYPYGGSTVPSTDCGRMCHRENLIDEHLGTGIQPPRRLADGSYMTCGTCHASTAEDVSGTIAAGSTDCRGCHDVHAQIATVHASSFTGSPDDACGGCHSSDLTVVHSGDMTTVLPSGRELAGCELCHDNFEGERGTVVQTAIEVTRDTRCTACHPDLHGDLRHPASSDASKECERCHPGGSVSDPSVSCEFDVSPIHASCLQCHAAADDRIPDGTGFECLRCHSAAGTDYHRVMDASHAFTTMNVSCLSSGCHVANSLPEEHARFAGDGGRYPAYADSCALCHLNEDPERIDWATANANCSTCHSIHEDVTAVHTAQSSQECVDCHETAVLPAIHATTPGDDTTSCAVCHNASTTLPSTPECVGCHATYTPADPNHYPADAHLAQMTGGCRCHSMDLKTEHLKETSGPIGCVQCHEGWVDAFTAPWNRSCDACHRQRHRDRR